MDLLSPLRSWRKSWILSLKPTMPVYDDGVDIIDFDAAAKIEPLKHEGEDVSKTDQDENGPRIRDVAAVEGPS